MATEIVHRMKEYNNPLICTSYGGYMKDFENELDEIRIKLYEETRGVDTKEIIKSVNSHARSIAYEFNINIKNTINEKYLQAVNL